MSECYLTVLTAEQRFSVAWKALTNTNKSIYSTTENNSIKFYVCLAEWNIFDHNAVPDFWIRFSQLILDEIATVRAATLIMNVDLKLGKKSFPILLTIYTFHRRCVNWCKNSNSQFCGVKLSKLKPTLLFCALVKLIADTANSVIKITFQLIVVCAYSSSNEKLLKNFFVLTISP